MWIVRGRDSFEASFSVFFRLTAACCILFLSACGGSTLGGGSPAPPTPTPPPSPASGSEFLYQFSFLSAIEVSTLNTNTGALSAPKEAIQSDLSVISAPSGEFVYAVVTDGTTTPPVVFSFSVSPTTNALAVVSSSPLPVGSPESIALSSTGNFLFLASPGNNLTVFGADASSGTISPTPLSQIPLQDYRGRVLIDPTGQFLIFNNGENTALSYKIDGATGALTLVSGSPFTIGANLTSTLVVGIP
ncbi:beta-propeller fold lactonase family protein [Tunturiibacter lichenicola]|uniref:beta-propeller fold lactonase family protein n=1 Tax=Tunturiibacter lichenicola TaxID=2051959 RepID=UPI0036F30CC6